MNTRPNTPVQSRLSLRQWCQKYSWLAVLMLAPACQDDDVRTGQGGTVIGSQDMPGKSDSGASTETDPECDGQSDGDACGEDQLERHCSGGRCVSNVCGDEVKAGAEECDDGNEASGDGCNASCQIECDDPDLDDTAQEFCGGVPASAADGCGDGKKSKGEECDDGNREARDKCSNHCTTNECGNSRVDPGEECDDGNDKAGDSCSSKCMRERCRNGTVDPGEECDDGNAIELDGCNNRCKVMVCGDGEQQDREECDDGNEVDDDKCSMVCTKNDCGNGRTDPGEDCDGDLNCVDCKLQEDTCTPCEMMHCREYLGAGVDWVEGCLNNKPNESYVPLPPEPMEFSGPCMDILACARRSQCVTDSGDTSADACYCGSANVTECEMQPAADAKCADFFLRATKAAAYKDVVVRMTDPSYPASYAYYLLACDVQFCRAECTPWLK